LSRFSNIDDNLGMVRLIRPHSIDLWRSAAVLVREYAGTLNVSLGFQDFEHELEHMEAEYGPPSGDFFLAEREGTFVGCGGIRRFSDAECEMKRLYVTAAAQGEGIGRVIAQRLIARGREIGYKAMLLDTLPSMLGAQALYRSMGFVPIEAYRFNPVAGTTYMKLTL
jgi:putative acetyltransferase